MQDIAWSVLVFVGTYVALAGAFGRSMRQDAKDRAELAALFPDAREVERVEVLGLKVTQDSSRRRCPR